MISRSLARVYHHDLLVNGNASRYPGVQSRFVDTSHVAPAHILVIVPGPKRLDKPAMQVAGLLPE